MRDDGSVNRRISRLRDDMRSLNRDGRRAKRLARGRVERVAIVMLRIGFRGMQIQRQYAYVPNRP